MDISELKGFQERSERHRVQDILSIETRRLETKLVDLLKKQEEASKAVPTTQPAQITAPSPANKAYDFVVKNYCK